MSVFIHPTAVVEEGAVIGAGSKIWHFAHVRKGAVLGEECIVGKNVFIDSGVTIGKRVKIQNNVSVYLGVEIGDGVFVGPHVCFTNDLYPRAVAPDFSQLAAGQWELGTIAVASGASIGANSTIVTGANLGAWCMVGAGSVVTRPVPAHALVYGNPARVRGVVSPSGKIVSRTFAPGVYSDAGLTFEVEG